MPKYPVSIVNESTVCPDDEIRSYMMPLAQQVSTDFAPVWGTDASLTFVAKGASIPSGSWVIAVLDNSDQAGALGYHDLTPDGQPLSKVFAATDKQYGMRVSVTLSHELLEMLGDPGINMTVFCPQNPYDPSAGPCFLAYEACDAPEKDSYGYNINGVTVSDFVYPDWFGGVAGKQYDHMGHISRPFEVLPGGYIGVFTMTQGWSQHTAKTANHTQAYVSRPPVGSRRERRAVGRHRWVPSTYKR